MALRRPTPPLPFGLRWKRRLRAFGWSLLLAGLLAGLWIANRPALQSGKALFVSDGDSMTLSLDGERLPVRLLGIDAPELAQSCRDAAGASWPCGRAARDALIALVPRGAAVQCRASGKDRFDRALSRCHIGEGAKDDLAAQLVARGWAVATSEDYLVEQSSARQAKRGIWRGDFETPVEWRAANPR